MNELLQQELLNIIQDSHSGIIKGIEVAKAKAPELVNQILMFGFYSNLINALMQIIILFLGLFSIIWGCYVLSKKDWGFDESNGVVQFVVGFLLIFFSLVFLFAEGNYLTLIKIKIAPSLYLLEYIKKLIK